MDGSDIPPGDRPGTDLIPRATLDELLGWRDRALTLAAEARECHLATLAKVAEAREAAGRAASGEYALHDLLKHVTDRHGDAEEFAARVRADMDRAIWPSILAMTGLHGLMDKQARDEFHRELSSDPPECTAENIRATFRQLKDDAHRIFRRGLVNVFRNLCREYRSHDGFKIGPRTVIDHAVTETGSLYHTEPTLADADRIMHLLDGRKIGPGWRSPLAAMLRNDIKEEYRRGRFSVVAGELGTRYWRAKWFKNGNIHLWTRRPDLLRRANRLIAEHFEEALGAGPDAAGAREYHRAKPHHHDVEDFYPTPPAVVERMVRAARLAPGLDVLEPSAGDGAIVAGILAAGLRPDAVEIDTDRADILRDMLPPGAVVEMDFLAMHPEPEYDRVLANFPFGKFADVQHCFHALRFLKPGGRLVAVMGPGLEYRTDGATTELRALIAAWGGCIEKLPAGSFKASGTMTDAVLVVLDKPTTAALLAPRSGAQPMLALEETA